MKVALLSPKGPLYRNRGGIFKNVVMRRTRKFTMDSADLAELDAIMEVTKPYFRV